MNGIDTFGDLARALLGDDLLDSSFLSELLPLVSAAHGSALVELLERWRTRPDGTPREEWLVQHLWPVPEIRNTCMDLVLSLLFGAPFKDGAAIADRPEDRPARAGLHFRGRFWDLVGAHPPGLAGGYFGHWMYPAEK